MKTVSVAAALCASFLGAFLVLTACQVGNAAPPVGKVIAAVPGGSDDPGEASEQYATTTREPIKFGERQIIANGLSITVSSPKLFTPSEIAYPPSPRAVGFSITIDNLDTDAFSPGELVVKAFADGDPLKQVADAKQGYTGTVGAPDTVPSGKTMRLTLAYAVPAETVTILVRVQPKADSPDFVEFGGNV